MRNVLAGILTRFTDPNGDLGISEEGWNNIAEYYKHGVPNESGVDLYGSDLQRPEPGDLRPDVVFRHPGS